MGKTTGKKANGKPAVLLSKVPSLRDICDALGFRNSKEQSAFTDFTHKWRKTYRTSDNRSGTDLIQWKLQKTQDDLTRMANTFLYGVGNGEKFWPQLEVPGDRLCFPDDEEKIIELLKQLFWKQNKYAFNNAKYPKNNESRDPFRYSVDRQSSRDTSERLAPSISTKGSANRPVTDMIIVAKVEDQHERGEEREDEESMTSESAPNKPQSTSKYAATCETEVEDDTYSIQDDDPPATPRASRRKNHHYDEPKVSAKKSATTSRNTSSKRPSQSTPNSSPKGSTQVYDRTLKRPKISLGRSSESINNDFSSPRRVSDRKPVPRVILGTVPSADINEYITDDQSAMHTVIEGNVPTFQSSNANSKSGVQVVPNKQHPASPPVVMETTEVEEDQARPKKDTLQHQSPTASQSLLTPLVASRDIPPSPSPSLHPLSPAALKASVPPESQLKPSPPPTKQPPLTQRSSLPTKHSATPTTPTAPTAPTAKAPLPIPFYILQHTDGIARQTFWDAGRFGTKSLDEFLVDLAEKLRCRPGDVTMVKLVLRLGPLEIDTDVEAGREDVWEMMKGRFKEEIRRTKARGIGMEAVYVLVEPVIIEKGGSQWGGDGEEDEFEL